MAKFGKILAGTALATAAVAAGMLVYNKLKESNSDFDDELNEFEENDFDDDDTVVSEYVSLNPEVVADAKEDIADAASDIKEDITDAFKDIKEDTADLFDNLKEDAADVVDDIKSELE